MNYQNACDKPEKSNFLLEYIAFARTSERGVSAIAFFILSLPVLPTSLLFTFFWIGVIFLFNWLVDIISVRFFYGYLSGIEKIKTNKLNNHSHKRVTESKDINYLLVCVIRALYFKKCIVTFKAEA